MKRIVGIIVIVMLFSIAVKAQSNYDPFRDNAYILDMSHIFATLVVIFLITTFILTLVKLFFDHRIKNRMIDKGVSENVVSQLLQPDKKDNSNIAIKWFIIFAGIGVGLTLIDVFQPFGIHSLAIMSFCIAAGFLGYYYFTKRTGKS